MMSDAVATNAPTRRFRLIAGKHVDAPPHIGEHASGGRIDPSKNKKYTQGDIVTTTRDMKTLYPNKFEEITEQLRPVSEERKKKIDLLMNGSDWKEEQRPFLEQIGDSDFDTLFRVSYKGEVLEDTPAVDTESDKPAGSIYGDDVTDKFQQAYDNQLRVYKSKSGKFQVVKPGTKKPLTPSALSEEEVEPFVADYLKNLAGK